MSEKTIHELIKKELKFKKNIYKKKETTTTHQVKKSKLF